MRNHNTGTNLLVPIAPLPSTVPTQTDNLRFPASALCPLDVLLKKGGRPTHGKKQFFAHCNASAEDYASFKSPIDRRLLARSLVEKWIERGGRFCVALTNPNGQESGLFRLASTEEALQFTRRVLVRHFTPSITNKKKNANAAATAATKSKKKIVVSKSNDSNKSSSTSTTPTACLSPSSTATMLPLTYDHHHLNHDTAEAVDALCFLSNVQPIHLPPSAAAVTTASSSKKATTTSIAKVCVSHNETTSSSSITTTVTKSSSTTSSNCSYYMKTPSPVPQEDVH